MRTIAVSLPLLTLGLIAGFVRLRDRGGGVDALMGATIAAWAIYAAFLGLRPTGRTGAHLALAGFALVIVARIALAGRSEEHTSELQSHVNLVCRLLLEKKKNDDTTVTDI